MSLYDNTSFPLLKVGSLSSWMYDCFSVRGYNHMEVPFEGVDGTPQAPSFSFASNPRTGMYSHGDNELGFSLFGYPSLVLRWGAIDLIDTSGHKGIIALSATANRTYTLPDASGTLALTSDISSMSGTIISKVNNESFTIEAGQPVKLDSAGIKLAQANDEANTCLGLAYATILSGASGQVILNGLLTVSDWTVPSGGDAALTVNADYFLSQGAAGIVTTIPPDGTGQICQYLGKAVTTTEIYLQIEQPTIM